LEGIMPRAPDTRQRIEAAALRLFVERGVAETSMRDIAAAVGVTEGALYRHCASKDDLVGRLFADNYARFAGALERLHADHPTLRGKLRAMVAEFCRFFDTNQVLFRFLLFVQHGQLNKIDGRTPSPVGVLRQVIAAAIERREIPRRDPDLATAWAMGLVLQTATFAVYGRIKGPLAALAAELAEVVWRALTLPATPPR
jgi:AcrR family transcriptional regulator